MGEVRPSLKLRLLDMAAPSRRHDYRDRLERLHRAKISEIAPPPVFPLVERVHALAADGDSTALQSIILTSLGTLDDVQLRQKIAASAALSLGQREMLKGMIDETEAMKGALNARLRTGAQEELLVEAAPTEADGSWWFALTETIEALDDGVSRLSGLVAGQQKGCTSRTLSGLVIRLMRRQHGMLLAEAEHWIA